MEITASHGMETHKNNHKISSEQVEVLEKKNFSASLLFRFHQFLKAKGIGRNEFRV